MLLLKMESPYFFAIIFLRLEYGNVHFLRFMLRTVCRGLSTVMLNQESTSLGPIGTKIREKLTKSFEVIFCENNL